MAERSGAHLIVLGNEKGGSGKTTTAFHLAIQLLYQGYNVATIDTDSRQQTFTHYVKNRRNWARKHGVRIPHTTHYHLPIAKSDSQSERNRIEFTLFRQAVGEVEKHADFLIVDTPGFDTHLTRLSHALADTLVTPVNDSLIDLDVLADIDPVTLEIRSINHYARLVQQSRKERLALDGKTIDWVIVRNRIASLSSRNMRNVQSAIGRISDRLGCRMADGIAERVAFRSLFSSGLTVFDPASDDVLAGGGVSQISARQEYRRLVDILNLPVRERIEERRARREEWRARVRENAAFEHVAAN
ncbi:division plane positioning ATPase MipZ [Maritalea sp.]|uniref:division plane positioning ATPase MipZ n=1 Tax=Maritalea sp. TaxID=2003361 RepID=UPI003EF60E4F